MSPHGGRSGPREGRRVKRMKEKEEKIVKAGLRSLALTLALYFLAPAVIDFQAHADQGRPICSECYGAICQLDQRFGPCHLKDPNDPCSDWVQTVYESFYMCWNPETGVDPGSCEILSCRHQTPPSCPVRPHCGDTVWQPELGEMCDDPRGLGLPAFIRWSGNGVEICNRFCQIRTLSCPDGSFVSGPGCPDNSIKFGGLLGNISCCVPRDCRPLGVPASPQEGCEGGWRLVGPCCFPPLCGDGVVNLGEQCDDRSLNNGDGCDENCQIEPGACGDGKIQNPNAQGKIEECEPRGAEGPNMIAGSNCNQAGWRCSGTCKCFDTTLCGNKRQDPEEECDDGNKVPNDGCDGHCKLECGDGTLQPGETCDPRGSVGCNAEEQCSADCTECKLKPSCGNGLLDQGEECDGSAGAAGACSGQAPNCQNCRCVTAWGACAPSVTATCNAATGECGGEVATTCA